jgi:hypothetical protein
MGSVKTDVRTASALLAAVLATAVAAGGASARIDSGSHNAAATRAACSHLRVEYDSAMGSFREAVRTGTRLVQAGHLMSASGVREAAYLRGCRWA